MNKKTKGFSLAELLISLLVISMVLSAAIPTITKRSGAEREAIWRWSSENNSAYYGTGSNQSAIIGYNATPLTVSNGSYALSDIMNDVNATSTATAPDGTYIGNSYETSDIDIGDTSFSNLGDKLIILKKTIQDDNSNFINSHISFYTMSNSDTATTNDIKYSGRLTMDQGNIALGMGTLQSIDGSNYGENTALGHFALLRDTIGIRNTAIGKKALSYNEEGNYNTAVGFGALFNLEEKSGASSSSGTTVYNSSENTSLGSLSAEHLRMGYGNTAIGSQALRNGFLGKSNTAIGRASLISLGTYGSIDYSDNNTAIGSHACSAIGQGNNNICIGYQAGNVGHPVDNYGLYIGSSTDEAPLITGHTAYKDEGGNRIKSLSYSSSGSGTVETQHDKELIVNARKVEFRPWDGSSSTFIFNSKVSQKDQLNSNNDDQNGYFSGSSSSATKTGSALFNLRDTGGAGDGTSVTMDFQATYIDANSKSYALFNTYDRYNTSTLVNLLFNGVLTFDYSALNNESGDKAVGILIPSDYILYLTNKLEIENSDDAPNLVMDSDGFELKYTNTSSKDMGINLAGDSLNLYNGSSNFYFNEGDLYVSEGTTVTMGGGNLVIGDNDITTTKLISRSGNYGMVDCINELYQTIRNLQQNINMGGWSDERLKNISGNNTAGLKEINALEVKNYTYKDDKEKTPHVGVIAQQLQKIFPNSVFEGDDGYLRIKTEEIFYAMVNSIKELFAQIQDLTAKITGLDKRITELENQNKLLLEQNKAFEKRLEKLEKNQ